APSWRRFGSDAQRPAPRADGVLAVLHRLVEHAEQFFLVEHHLFAAGAGQLEDRSQLDGVARAGLLAHPAVDASQLVDNEGLRVLLTVGPRRRGGHDVDAVGRAGGGAHVAGYALDAALFVTVEAVDAAVVGRQVRADLRVLLRDLRGEEVAHGGLHALPDRRQVEFLRQAD